MKKLLLYLDTSVLNFYYAKDCPEEMEVTKKLFHEIKMGKYEAFISSLVVEEISRASEVKKQKLLKLIDMYKLEVLEINEDVQMLAETYIKNKIIPIKYEEDAVHIGIVAVNNLDVIISWNFEHIVKLTTKIEVNGINKLQGYKEIEICTPLEVIDI